MNPRHSRFPHTYCAGLLLATGLFAAAARADDSAQALTIGTTVHGEITSGGCLERYGGGTLTPDVTISDVLDGPSREIPLMIEAAGIYQIDLRSDAFDTKLELSGDDVWHHDDDSGDGTNSRIVVPLKPGLYDLKVSGYGYDDSARGPYTLSVAEWTPPEVGELHSGGALPLNREVNGMLTDENHYTLELNSRQLVKIGLKSDIFDPYLELSGNGVSAKNDDSGDGLNARILRILEPGTYQITVKSAPGSFTDVSTGLFRLSATGREVPEGAGRGDALDLRMGVRAGVSANLLEGLPNRHTFNVSQRGTYGINLYSDDINSYLCLRLYRGGELIARGYGFHAEIEEELAPGEYVVEASSCGSLSGNYGITAWRR